MHRFAKSLVLAIALAVALPLLSLAAYDAMVFQPRRLAILGLLAGADPAEQRPPQALLRVLKFTPINLQASHAARLLVPRLSVRGLDDGVGARHLTDALWWVLLRVHFSDQEITTLYLSLSHMGEIGDGYAAAAPVIVGSKLSDVSIEQSARLVTFATAPSRYEGKPELLATQASRLSAKAQAVP